MQLSYASVAHCFNHRVCLTGYTVLRAVTSLQKNGERLPGKKGIMLTPTEWQTLASNFGALTAALSNSSLDFVAQVSNSRKATISDFKKDALSVDIREWYEKDGESKPGQKGISLNSDAFQVRIPGCCSLVWAQKGPFVRTACVDADLVVAHDTQATSLMARRFWSTQPTRSQTLAPIAAPLQLPRRPLLTSSRSLRPPQRLHPQPRQPALAQWAQTHRRTARRCGSSGAASLRA